MTESSPAHLHAVFSNLIEATRQSGAAMVPCDMALRSHGKTYMLRSRQSFKVAYPKRRSVSLCELVQLDANAMLGVVVVKTFRPWSEHFEAPREPRFYQSLGQQAEVNGLKIPKLYAAHEGANGTAQLFLEYLEGLTPLASYDDLRQAARALGRMAGHSHVKNLHREDWLPQASLVPRLHKMTALEELLHALPLGPDERSEISGSYGQFLARLADLNADYSEQLATLCHGDIGPNNLQLYGESVAALDWETASAGRMGDDLARLATRMARDADPHSPKTAGLIADYVEEVSSYVRSDPAHSIKRVFRAKFVTEKLGQVDSHMLHISDVRSGAVRRRRLRKLAHVYRQVALHAREAVQDLSCLIFAFAIFLM